MVLAIFMVFFLVLTFYSAWQSTETSEKHETAYAFLLIDQSEILVRRYVEGLRQMATQLRGSGQVQDFLLAPKWSGLIDAEMQLEPAIAAYLDTSSGIAGISVFAADRQVRYYGSGALYFNNPPPLANEAVFTDIYRNGEQEAYYYYVVPIHRINRTSYQRAEIIGYILFELDAAYYYEIFEQYLPSPNAQFFFTDTTGSIVAASGSRVTPPAIADGVTEQQAGTGGTVTVDGVRYMYVSRRVEGLGYTMAYMIPSTDIGAAGRNIILANTTIFVLFFLLCIVLATFIVRDVLSSIGKISRFADTVRNDDTGATMDITLKNELQPIVDSVNQMIRRNNEASRQVLEAQRGQYQAEAAEKQATLDALQAQINPHFLYNTLECIRSMADISGVDGIGEVSVALGKLFRYSISSGRVATLQAELEAVQDYFRIITIRYQGKYSLHVRCGEDLYPLPMLKMGLQPLVENAVVHGLEHRRGPGAVGIVCQRENGCLAICISDDGQGVPPARLAGIQQQLEQPANARSIGIFNTADRLRHVFGERARITLESEPGRGAVIHLRIPLDTAPASTAADTDNTMED